tara:strand:- start:671 stop:1066 length:396 start_codon:yes stop_codon:yes gene_type:complete
MAFKLGSSPRYNASQNARTPSKPLKFMENRGEINRLDLDDGVVAEANMDGSINVDSSVDLNSALGKRAIKHEKKHIEQMQSGEAAYGDNYVMWQGKLYIRKDGMIHGPNGKLPEGHKDHPWEQEAINAEKE